eukprot:sb/3469743/
MDQDTDEDREDRERRKEDTDQRKREDSEDSEDLNSVDKEEGVRRLAAELFPTEQDLTPSDSSSEEGGKGRTLASQLFPLEDEEEEEDNMENGDDDVWEDDRQTGQKHVTFGESRTDHHVTFEKSRTTDHVTEPRTKESSRDVVYRRECSLQVMPSMVDVVPDLPAGAEERTVELEPSLEFAPPRDLRKVVGPEQSGCVLYTVGPRFSGTRFSGQNPFPRGCH